MLADITDDGEYPPTLLLEYVEGDVNRVYHTYNPETDIVTVSVVEPGYGLRVDTSYRLGGGFPVERQAYFKRKPINFNVEYEEDLRNIRGWEEVTRDEWSQTHDIIREQWERDYK